MRSHWVLLIVCLITIPVISLALCIAFAIALAIAMAVKRLNGMSMEPWMVFSIMLTAFGPLFYGTLRLVKPDKVILRLLRR